MASELYGVDQLRRFILGSSMQNKVVPGNFCRMFMKSNVDDGVSILNVSRMNSFLCKRCFDELKEIDQRIINLISSKK